MKKRALAACLTLMTLPGMFGICEARTAHWNTYSPVSSDGKDHGMTINCYVEVLETTPKLLFVGGEWKKIRADLWLGVDDSPQMSYTCTALYKTNSQGKSYLSAEFNCAADMSRSSSAGYEIAGKSNTSVHLYAGTSTQAGACEAVSRWGEVTWRKH